MGAAARSSVDIRAGGAGVASGRCGRGAARDAWAGGGGAWPRLPAAPSDVDAERAEAQGRAERHQGGWNGRIRCLDAALGGAWPRVSAAPVSGSRRVSDRARLELNPSLFVLPLLSTESRFVSSQVLTFALLSHLSSGAKLTTRVHKIDVIAANKILSHSNK